jgi:putative flippase GtrA
VVVPTRNEADNVDPLLDALESVVGHLDVEVLFVDDSDDGTPAVVGRRILHGGLRIELLHRDPDERADGLGGAVAAGLARARGRWVCVLDADLQHPPALIPRLLAEGIGSGADVVVASRYCGSGGASPLGALRGAISHGSAALARLLFPRRLRGVSDPMSGFFLVRRERLQVAELRPHGFKILLEILARHRASVREVPYEFGVRHAGESKASVREGLRFLRHLARLRLGERNARLARFAVVGASGVVVNTAVLFGLSWFLGLHYLAWAFVATQVSILWNFCLSEIWVFRGRGGDRRVSDRLLPFLAVNNLAMAFGGPLLFVLASLVGIEYLLANIISIGLLTIARFAAADTLIWSEGPRGEPLAGASAQPARPAEISAVFEG